MPKIGHLAAKISEEKKIGQFSIKKFFLIQKHFHCLNFLSQNFPQPFTQFLSPIYCFCTYFGANLGIRQKFLRKKISKTFFQKHLHAMWRFLENPNYRFLRVVPIYRKRNFENWWSKNQINSFKFRATLGVLRPEAQIQKFLIGFQAFLKHLRPIWSFFRTLRTIWDKKKIFEKKFFFLVLQL